MRFGIVQNDEMLRQRALNRADAYARGGWEASRVGSLLCLPPVGAACGSFLARPNSAQSDQSFRRHFGFAASASLPQLSPDRRRGPVVAMPATDRPKRATSRKAVVDSDSDAPDSPPKKPQQRTTSPSASRGAGAS